MKIKVSLTISDQTLAVADSVATVLDRSRSWVIDAAARAGLKQMDTPAAQALRATGKKKKKAQE